MYSPTLGRWIQNDPIEFEAGDPNLYRFVGNSPTNASDPSGLFIAFDDPKGAEAFLNQLKTKYGATGGTVVVGKDQSYLVTDPRDRDAIFKYADDTFGKVFVGSFAGNQAAREAAKMRTQFLNAAGVFGSVSDVFLAAYPDGKKLQSCESNAQKKLLDAEKAILDSKAAIPPLVLDIGGEGEQPGAVNWNVLGIGANQKPIPRFVPRVDLDSELDAPDGSIDRIMMSSVPLNGNPLRVTAAEIARLIKPGGTIVLENTEAGKNIHDTIIKACGAGASSNQTVITRDGIRVLTTTITMKR